MTTIGYTEFWANLTPLQRIDEKIRVAKYQLTPDANRLASLHTERTSLLGEHPDAPVTCVVDARLSSGVPHVDDGRLAWGVVANAGRLSSSRGPRWSHVKDVTGFGSSSAKALCRSAGFDPDEDVGGEEAGR